MRLAIVQRTLVFFAICFLPVHWCSRNTWADDVSFNRDIRPILADKCFHCHGPDSSTREADLRLDLEEEVFGDRDQATIQKGNAEDSELYRRIIHTDPDSRMPPADSKRTLSKAEVQLIKAWIDQGAKWESHWAFVPPTKPVPPTNANTNPDSWGQNEIDQFVLAAMQKQGLKPSPSADKRTLIRRVTLDLTGLPPTVGEINSFLSDDSPDAFEKLVDRLLASPHYGERMAQIWLDAARYADSHGYSLDRRRVMWPWRDWVIQSYNQNKPFDEFAIEQLAGDLIPGSTVDQKVATGFNRNHPIQSEGGVINEEYRIETVVDRVETTSAVFLGLTMGCGRCHDHKYEPISQTEFYQFFAFFNNVPETAHVGNADNQADRPFIKAPSPVQTRQVAELNAKIELLKKEIANTSIQEQPRVEVVWIDDGLPAGASPFGNGDGPQEFLFQSKSKQTPVLSGSKSSVRESKGLGQHGFTGAKTPLVIKPGTKLFAYVFIDSKNPPKEIMLQFNSGQSWEHRAIWGDDLIAWGQKNTTSRKHLGQLPKAGEWVRLEVDAAQVGLVGKSLSGWAYTQFDGKVFWDKSGVVTKKQTQQDLELARLGQELKAIQNAWPTVMVMSEMKPARKTFVLNRGQYDAPTDKQVIPAIPEVLGQLPAQSKPDRLALAKWMLSQDNPLTARVTVNRYWQMYFGNGLVGSTEDFGTQGTPPSHPLLLDWLAEEFRESGWNVKAMQKKIVMSATYQQSSRISPASLEKDPTNQWLARGPRFRLSAEAIRDQALAVSGLLNPKVGGKSVRPYQPPGLWKDVVYSNVPKFQQDHGEDLYRRSIYTYWKRSVPPPNLQTLDAPSREACTLKRSRTNTPQATLVLWNDPTFVEAARILAEQIVSEQLSDRDSLSLMFERVTARRPDESELKKLEAVFSYFKDKYQRDPQAAEEFLAIGEFPRNKKLETKRVAALGAIANALFGLDETLTKN